MKTPLFAFAAALCLAALAPLGAFAKTNNNAYVANDVDGTVSVIDNRTGAVTATIGGFENPFCTAVSPNGKLLYVCNGDNSVVAVDTESNSVITHISLPGAEGFVGDEGTGSAVVFNRHGERAYVVTSGGGVNSTLYAINTECNTVVSSTSFGSTFLESVAVSPNGDDIYIASSNGVLVVDADTDALTTTIVPGDDVTNLVLSSNGDRLYAADNSAFVGGSNGVLVVDTKNNSVVTTVSLPFGPSLISGLALSRDGRHLYAENFFFVTTNSTVEVIDTHNNAIETTINAKGLSLIGLALSRDGRKLLAVNGVLPPSQPSTVAVIDVRNNAITDSVEVGLFADSIGTQPGSTRGDDDDDNRGRRY